MGTQQILLIVLSVIIVGAAIAVGITMFNNQAYTANKSAIAADAQSFATQIVQYYKTPTSQGGAGKNASFALTPPVDLMTPVLIGAYAGWDVSGADPVTTTESGEFTLTSSTTETGGGDTTVVITGVGTEIRNSKSPQVVTTIVLPAGTITAVLSDV